MNSPVLTVAWSFFDTRNLIYRAQQEASSGLLVTGILLGCVASDWLIGFLIVGRIVMNGISGWTWIFPPLRDSLREPALMRMQIDWCGAGCFDSRRPSA